MANDHRSSRRTQAATVPKWKARKVRGKRGTNRHGLSGQSRWSTRVDGREWTFRATQVPPWKQRATNRRRNRAARKSRRVNRARR